MNYKTLCDERINEHGDFFCIFRLELSDTLEEYVFLYCFGIGIAVYV